MKKLIEHFTVLTPEILSKTTEKELLPLLTCKFKENKAKYIIATSKLIHEQYHDNIPNDYEKIKQFPGIGEKLSVIVYFNIFDTMKKLIINENSLELFKRIGWYNETTNKRKTLTMQYNECRKQIEDWLPKDKWNDFPKVTILFSRIVCTKLTDCKSCPLKEKGLCSFNPTMEDSLSKVKVFAPKRKEDNVIIIDD